MSPSKLQPRGAKPPRKRSALADKHVYWIMRPDQVEALASAVRLDILDWLVMSGPLTVRALAQVLGRKPTAIYHHLAQMEELGLVRSFPAEVERGRPALVFAPAAPMMRLAHAPLRPENRSAMAKVARVVGNEAAKEYAAAFKSDRWKVEGEGRNLWFFRVVASPSPRRLKQINAMLEQLVDLMWSPDPEPGELTSIAWILAPLTKSSKKPSAKKPSSKSRSGGARSAGRKKTPSGGRANAIRKRSR